MRKKNYPLSAFVLAAILMLLYLAMSGQYFGAPNTILDGDLFSQYEGFILMFLRVLRGEQDLWYSFSIYFGSGTALTYAYYTLSPLNLLYLLPRLSFSDITLLVIAFKHGLAAMTFVMLEQHFLKRRSFDTVLFALCYSLCTFSVAFSFNLMWFDALYTMPVIIICIDIMLRTKRCIPLVLSYFYLFFTNFYMAFILGVFTGLVFLALMINQMQTLTRHSLLRMLGSSLRFLGCVLLAAGLCACLLLPAGLFLFSHSAEDNFAFDDIIITLPELLNSFLMWEMPDLNNDTPLFYCGLPILLLFPVYFYAREIPLKEKLISASLLLLYFFGCFYQPLYILLHAFDYPNFYAFRFVLAPISLLIFLAARALPYLRSYPFRRHALAVLALILLYSLLIPLFNARRSILEIANTPTGLLVNTAFLLLWLLAIYFYLHTERLRSLCRILSALLLCTELVMNGWLIAQFSDHGYITKKRYDYWYSALSEHIAKIKAEDPGFYRISLDADISYNTGTVFGYAPTDTFSSSDDYELRRALTRLGVETANRSLTGHGYNDITYMLFSRKYLLHMPEDYLLTTFDEAPHGEVSVEVFPYALPLGYMVSGDILSYAPSDNPFANQESLLKCMTGHSYHFYTPIDRSDIYIDYFNLRREDASSVVSFSKRSGRNISIAQAIYAARVEEGDLYLCLTVDEPKLYGLSPYYICEQEGYYSPPVASSATIVKGRRVDDEWQETPDGEYNTIILQFDDTTADTYSVRGEYLSYYKDDELAAAYDDLASYPMQITEMSDSNIYAIVEVDASRPILYTSIPYDEGWNAEVDGMSWEPLPVMEDAFLALQLPPGTHTIHLQYIAPGSDAGRWISLGSLLCLIALGIAELHGFRRKPRKDASNL